MSSDVSTELHSAVDNKIKIRPGSTITLSEELQLPSGVYIIYIEVFSSLHPFINSSRTASF